MLRRVIFWIACAAVAGLPVVTPTGNRTPRPAAFPGWPATFEGCSLVPASLTDFDRSVAARFPGQIGRFHLDGRVVLLRWLAEPSRGLHPAADCFRGSGYQVRPLPVWAAPSGSRWGCLHAERGAERLRIRAYRLAQVIGYTDFSFNRSTEIAISMNKIELAMVLDITGSMNDNGNLDRHFQLVLGGSAGPQPGPLVGRDGDRAGMSPITATA